MAEMEEGSGGQLLSSDEAKLAARYSTVEINGWAGFLSELANSKPVEVDEIIGGELAIQLTFGGSHSYLPELQNLTNADKTLKAALAPRLIEFLRSPVFIRIDESTVHWNHNLEQIFTILEDAIDESTKLWLASVCDREFKKSPDDGLSMTWLRGLFRFNSEQAVVTFIDIYANGHNADRVRKAFASIFGSWDNIGLRIPDNDSRALLLGSLVRCIYKYAPIELDLIDDDAFSANEEPLVDLPRDAQRARSYLLSMLIETPGFKSQQILCELASEPEFSSFPDRLRYLAKERAAKDAEFAAWDIRDVCELEKNYETPPWDRDTLYRVMLDRLNDMQHDFWHDDFTQRKMIGTVQQEAEMQKVIAHRLREMSKGVYLITREEEVADCKKTDIRITSRKKDAKAVIEIKIADDRWKLKDFEKALKHQLTKQYLRHKDCSAGCLLLTYNGKQTNWNTGRNRKPIGFRELVDHLAKIAKDIEAKQSYEIRLAVFGLDLTDSYLKESAI